MAEIKNYTLNFGPQHPAAHGVLRLVLELDGEVVQRADPHIGLLHRATEKLAETKTYIQSLPYMDRLDYVSMMCNEHAYCLTIERKLWLGSPQARAIHPGDVCRDHAPAQPPHVVGRARARLRCVHGDPDLYAFREREALFDMYEAVSGARMHAAYFRPGGVYRDLAGQHAAIQGQQGSQCATVVAALNENRQGSLLDFIDDFCTKFPNYVDEYETLLTDNRIWKQRTVGVGAITAERA